MAVTSVGAKDKTVCKQEVNGRAAHLHDHVASHRIIVGLRELAVDNQSLSHHVQVHQRLQDRRGLQRQAATCSGTENASETEKIATTRWQKRMRIQESSATKSGPSVKLQDVYVNEREHNKLCAHRSDLLAKLGVRRADERAQRVAQVANHADDLDAVADDRDEVGRERKAR